MAGGVELVAVDGQRLRMGPWRNSARLGFVAPVGDGTPLRGATVRQALERLGRAGFDEVLTGAIPEPEAQPFLDVGFRVRERLHLLVHPLVGLRSAPRASTRRARAVDRASVLGLDQLAFQPFWQLDADALDDALTATPVARFRVTGTGRGTVRGATGPVTGYAVFGWSMGRGYLQRLAVHPDHRGHGHAEALVWDGLGWLSRRGAQRAWVNTQEGNERALRLYRRLGFVNESHGLVVLAADVRP